MTESESLRAIARAADEAAAVLENGRDQPNAEAVIRTRSALEEAWNRYLEQRGLFFEL